MNAFKTLALVAATICVGLSANAQTYPTSSGIPQEPDVASGDLRAPSPRIADPDRPGYFQVGVGPSFGIGLATDQVMYDINAGYNYNLNDVFTGKLFGDFNLGSDSNTARWINLGMGGDFYMQEVRSGYGIPYLTADLSYGFVRANNARTVDAVALGAGAGFKFAAESLNVDVNLHYTVLTEQLDNRTPSLVGMRAALAF